MRRIALITAAGTIAGILTLAAPAPADVVATITPDATFGEGGVTVIPTTEGAFDWAHAGTVDHLGRVLVQYPSLGGEPEGSFVVRLDAGGDLDGSFGTGGRAELVDEDFVASSVAATEHGVAASNIGGPGGAPMLVRLEPDGDPDPRFGNGGYLDAPDDLEEFRGVGVALAPDGDLLAAISTRATEASPLSNSIYRYRTDGELDTTFGGDGVVDAEDLGMREVGFMELDPSGRIVAVAEALDDTMHVVRLTATGALDPSFGRQGVSRALGHPGLTPAVSQTDGSIVVVGSSGGSAFVRRLTPNGAFDRRFGDDGLVVASAASGNEGVAVLRSGYVALQLDDEVQLLDRSGAQVAQTTWDAADEIAFLFGSLWETPTGQLVAATFRALDTTEETRHVAVRRFVVAAPSLAPAVTSIERLDGALSVEWAAPESVPAAHPVRTYHVLALDGGEVASQAVVAGDVRQASLEGVSNGEAYEVVVVGYDDVGTIPASPPFAVPAGSGDLPDPSPAPAVPGVEVAAGRSSATVSWDPLQDDGGSTIWGYAVVALRHSDGSFAQWRNVRADVRTATLPGLTNDTAYDVHVFAVTTEGFGALGSSAAVTPSAAAPAPAAPQMSWVSVVPIGAHAVVTWGPATERGEVTSAVHVIVIEDGAMAGWKAMSGFDRQVVVPAGPGAQVFVIAQSASGFGPLAGPVAVPA
jgi:uncharacterized delta-60 repeat protein